LVVCDVVAYLILLIECTEGTGLDTDSLVQPQLLTALSKSQARLVLEHLVTEEVSLDFGRDLARPILAIV
jgi:hypothetical protein